MLDFVNRLVFFFLSHDNFGTKIEMVVVLLFRRGHWGTLTHALRQRSAQRASQRSDRPPG